MDSPRPWISICQVLKSIKLINKTLESVKISLLEVFLAGWDQQWLREVDSSQREQILPSSIWRAGNTRRGIDWCPGRQPAFYNEHYICVCYAYSSFTNLIFSMTLFLLQGTQEDESNAILIYDIVDLRISCGQRIQNNKVIDLNLLSMGFRI